MIRVAAIITAAGASRRMGKGQKKEYLELEGRPVLVRAIQPFLLMEELTCLILTVPPGDGQRASQLLDPHLDLAALRIVEGGTSRQESVRRGLEALERKAPQWVLIHDGARPWVSLKLIRRVLRGAEQYGACIPLGEVSEAPKLVGPSGWILADLDRRRLGLAQTPQGFSFTRILEAHRQAGAAGTFLFDDAEAYSAYIGPVFTVPGEVGNRKITYPADLAP